MIKALSALKIKDEVGRASWGHVSWMKNANFQDVKDNLPCLFSSIAFHVLGHSIKVQSTRIQTAETAMSPVVHLIPFTA